MKKVLGVHLHRKLLITTLAVLGLALGYELYAWAEFYENLSSSRQTLEHLEEDLTLDSLDKSEAEVQVLLESLRATQSRLLSASHHVSTDPLLVISTHLPFVKKHTTSLRQLVYAATHGTNAGVLSAETLLSYVSYEPDPNRSSIDEGISLLDQQAGRMEEISFEVAAMKKARSRIANDAWQPLADGTVALDRALSKLEGLSSGYNKASALLPELLGFNESRTYLVLAQNETELFASGGLISNYGIARFSEGRIVYLDFEYFVDLFLRWQARTNEYVEPPSPLRNHLLKDTSWELGEAGWYPDFPTTARLATSFVHKDRIVALNGVIAIDLHFVEEMLRLLGPTTVPSGGSSSIVISHENFAEVLLEVTRHEASISGAQGKTFLGNLAGILVTRITTIPRSQWLELLQLFDRNARQRHLQFHFFSSEVQAVAREYGLTGELLDTTDDFLSVIDTSVNSTKLNLITESSIDATVYLQKDGTARHTITYGVKNPFPTWQLGRNSLLVKTLMLEGVYGSYTRLYAPAEASYLDLQLNGVSVGAEQIDRELGKSVFGRYFPVLPGTSSSLTFVYEVKDVVQRRGDHLSYSLLVQKQAGTKSIPLNYKVHTGEGLRIAELKLNGSKVSGQFIQTSLLEDQVIEIVLTE